MKAKASSVIDAVVTRLREQAKRFNPSLESAPVAVLWTDERRDWEAVLPNFKSVMAELFSLGDFKPDARSGPGVWLRMVADRQAGGLAPDQVPVIYLPGVGNGSLRTDLRTVKDDPQLAPLAELQYRGTFWRQDNSKDWTLRAFFESKRHGLGVGIKGDQETLAALKRALPKLLTRLLVTLEGRLIDLAFLDEILNPNPDDDVLRWLADPAGLQQEKGEAWPNFVASSKQRYGIDLAKSPLDAAALVLEASESDTAFALWQKFALRPAEQAELYEVFKAVPTPDLLSSAERYPKENEADEQALALALQDASKLDVGAAAAKILALETQHAPRRNSVWARMGKAPLAQALLSLATVARAAAQPVVGGTVVHQAAMWAAEGWRVDAAAMTALAFAQAAGCEAAVEPVLAALYRPWLQRAAEAFQQRVQVEGYPQRGYDPVPDGTLLLFVDGLRLDLARQLESALETVGLKPELQHRFTSVPSVTSSGKVWCSPAYAAAQASQDATGFEPVLRLSGSDGGYTAERLRRVMEDQGIAVVEGDAPAPAPAKGSGWAEFLDDIDSDGHHKGLRLAEETPRHLLKLAKTVQRLLNAGWKRVRVVTDHGWLLLPGGLPKVELHAALTETRWSRCAVLKDTAQGVEAMVLPWSYGPEVRIALAPGIGAFRAGKVYDHGGLTLQESVVPMLDVTLAQPLPGRAALKGVAWNSRKTICTVQTSDAQGLSVMLERLGNVIGEPGTIDTSGRGRIVFEEVDDLLGEVVSVLLRSEGQKVAEEICKFGEGWHAA